MATGYLVTLGDGILNAGDVISGNAVTFTDDVVLGDGRWIWSGTAGGTTYTNASEPGQFIRATDGNVYFVPELGLVDTLTSSTVEAVPTDGTVTGTAGDDTIAFGYDDDPAEETITRGADTIEAGSGDDSVASAAGDDTIEAGAGNDTVSGGAGNDTIEGDIGNDLLIGDQMTNADGEDSISGGEGDDVIYGDSQTVAGATAEDTVFQWSTQGVADEADISDGFTGLSANGDVRVTLSVDEEANFTSATMELNDPLFDYNGLSDTSSIALQGGSTQAGPDSGIIRLDFSAGNAGFVDEVSNVSFGIFDLDEIQNAFIDQIIVRAYDADGNLVPVTLTLSGQDPNAPTIVTSTDPSGVATATSVLNSGGAGATDSASGFVQVSVAGPVAQIEIDYNNTDTAYGTHWIRLGDIEMTSIPAVDNEGANDTLDGGAGDDEIFGQGGDDSIQGGTGEDSLFGGVGNDIIDDSGTTADTIDGGDGNDIITAGGGADNVTGGDGADSIRGEGGSDDLFGGAGDDTIRGDGGNDEIFGGADNDTLDGDNGNDTLNGGIGDDQLSGDAGNDTLVSSAGDDVNFGGTGDDTFIVSDNSETETITGGEDAGDGDIDVIDFATPTSTAGVTVDFNGDEAGTYDFDGTTASGSFTEIERLVGTDHADTVDLTGDSAGITVETGAGNDTITTGQGDDDIAAGTGSDTIALNNGFGQDTIVGGEDAGSGEAAQGDDVDVLDAGGVTTDIVLDITSPETGTLTTGGNAATFSEIEEIVLGSGDDSVTGSAGNDTVDLGQGTDTINAGAGDDIIDLGQDSPGNPDEDPDVVVLEDGFGDDIVTNFDAPTPNPDGTFDGIDMLDVTNLNDNTATPVTVSDVTVTDDGSGNAVLTFPGGESLTLVGISPTDADNPNYLEAIGIPPDPPAVQDGIVSGDASDNTIDLAYAGDPDGDFVDADDALLAGEVANDDIIEGLGGNDSIIGGDGNDQIFGDAAADPNAGIGQPIGQLFTDATNIQAGSFNSASGTSAINDAQPGDSIIFEDAATLANGDQVAIRVTVVSISDPNVTVILDDAQASSPLRVVGTSAEAGENVEFQVEFIDQATGEPLTLTGNATIVDIDDNPDAGNEFVSFSENDISSYSVDGNTSLVVPPAAGGVITASGTTANDPTDQDAWFGVGFEDTTQLNFTVGVVEGTANYGFSGLDLTNPVTTAVAGGNDTIDGGVGDDYIAGNAGQDVLTGGEGDDTILGGAGSDTIFGGSGDTIIGGEDADGLDIDVLNAGAAVSVDYTDENGAPVAGPTEFGTVTYVDGTTLSFSEIETLNLTILDGTVSGTAGDDVIDGNYVGDPEGDIVDNDDAILTGDVDNDDLILGFEGEDSILAGDGADEVYGGEGADTIDGGAGEDVLFGGVFTGDTAVNDLIVNGSFEDLTGVTNTVYGGVSTGSLTGWTEVNNGELDLHDDGKGGTFATDGTYVLDMGGSPTNVIVYQDIQNVVAGETYDLSLDAGDVTGGGNAVEVYWNGELIDTIDPVEGGMESFSYTVTGGSGDGSNRLLFSEIGPNDVDGVQLDNIQFVGVDASLVPTEDQAGDTIDGGADDDTIYGLRGDDTLDGGTGDDTLFGGEGSDTFALNDAFGNDTIVGGEDAGDTDTDVLDLSGVTTDLTIDLTDADPEAGTVTDGTDTTSFIEIEDIVLSAGDDTLVLADGSGDDVVQGFTAPTPNVDGTFNGTDVLDVTALFDRPIGDPTREPVNTNDVTVSDDGNGNAVLTFPNGETLTLIGIPPADADNPFYLNAIGIPLPDGTVSGDNTGNLIDGSYLGDPDGDIVDNDDAILAGDTVNDDLIEANGGDDTVFAGDGNDEVYGGTGNDTLDGGTGDDTLFGDAGNDIITIGDADGTDAITGGEDVGGADLDIVDFSGVTGTEGVDVDFTGDEAGDYQVGGAGSDGTFGEIEGIIGTDNADTIDLSGDTTGISVDAGTGDDVITGGTGDDEINAGAGQDDVIIGDNFGNDDIDGGAVADGTGDVLDGAGLTQDVTVAFSGAETGTIDNATDTADFAEIEAIITGAGDDTVIGAGGDDNVSTGAGVDTITGGAGNDTFDAGAGDDTIDGGTGDDAITAGTGNDTVQLNDGFGDDTITAGEDAGNGDTDILDATGVTADTTLDLTAPETGTITDGADTASLAEIEQFFLGSGNDTATGSVGDDFIDLGLGDDSIDAGQGDDIVAGGLGDDTIALSDQFGNDTITGGEDAGNGDTDVLDATDVTDDTVLDLTAPETGTITDGSDTATLAEIEEFFLGSGNDSATGSIGDDTIDLGAGDDSINAGTGDDSVTGGLGDDTIAITNDFGNDTVDAGEDVGNGDTDVLDGSGLTDDVTVTLTGDEVGTVTDGVDTLNFDNVEAIETGSGDDIVVGGTGDDSVSTGAGNDVISGGAGADTFDAGDGNDVITFAEGDDLDGGDGDDTFILEDLGEPTNGVITIVGGDGDETPVDEDAETGGDILQLGDLADLSTLVQTSDGINASGNETFSGTVELDDGTTLNFSGIEQVICFTPGTNIATPRGSRPIETLRVGDMVVTRDHGMQPIRWIEQRTVPATDKFAPVRLRPGTVTGLERDLLVSPQHRMLFQGYRAELLFGESEVLMPATHLIDDKAVTREEGGFVTYIHMMFDEHEVVYAEGAATESFHPGEIGLTGVTDAAREELFALFPQLRSDPKVYGRTARRTLKKHESQMLRTK